MNYYNEIKNKIIDNEVYSKVKDYSKERHKVITYFEIGKLLTAAGGKYGDNIIDEYSKKLVVEVGKKYNRRTLFRMKQFYNVFSNEKVSTLWTQLTWSHLRLLFNLEIDSINYYIQIIIDNHLSVRELEFKIKSNEYERLPIETKNKLIVDDKIEVKDLVPNPIIIRNRNNIEIINDFQVTKVTNKDNKFFVSGDKKVKVTYLTDVKPNREELKEAIKKKNVIKVFKEGLTSIKVLNKRKSSIIKYIKETDSDVIISTRALFDKWLSDNKKDNILTIGWEHNHNHGDMKIANTLINSCKKLDYLVMVSNNLKEYYEDKFDKTKVIYIPNVVDNIPDKLSKLNEKRLVCVGRLAPGKGQMELLEIMNKIKDKYPDWILDVIGDGDEKEKLENYIKENNLNNVVMHGFQNKEYIDKILNKSSIYLMASHTESFGIVLIEAMSHGVPCIAYTSAEGANEIIENGKNGYLIENRNEEEFINKLEELINDEKLRKTLGKYARESIYEYTTENVEKLWFKILE